MKRLLTIFALLLLPLVVAHAQDTPGTVLYPTQVDSADSLFQTKDTARARLASAMTSGSSTMTVDSTAPFAVSGSLQVYAEVIYYTSKNSTQFLGLVRGANGTVAASHPANTIVTAPMLGVHHNTLAAALVLTQTKLGKGASDASAAASGTCIKKNADGTTTWQACAGGAGGGDAYVANPLSQFASTTSAQVAGVVSNESGTGLLVFNTSPAFVTPTLGVASTTSLAITGTAGAGFTTYPTQSAAPAAPASGFRDYADSTGRKSWIRASDGFTRTWNATLTANRIYTLPDASDTIVGRATTDTLTNKTISGASNTLTNLPAANISGVIPIANLATGTPTGTKFIRDDGTLVVPSGSGDMVLNTAQTNTAKKTFNNQTFALIGAAGFPASCVLGDFAVNSTDNRFYRCITTGTPGTWGEILVSGVSNPINPASGGLGADNSASSGYVKFTSGAVAFKTAAQTVTDLGIPYDVAVSYDGAPTASSTIRFVAARSSNFTASFAGTVCSAGTSATAQTDFLVKKNGTTVATLRFAAAGTTCSIVSPTTTTLVATDVVTIVAPGTPDTTLANIAITLQGVLP